MYFFLSKTLDVFLDPLLWVLLLLLLALVLRRRRPRLAIGAVGLAALALYVFSLPAVANRLARSLEAPPLTTLRPDAVYDVAVVLSGIVDDAATDSFGETQYNAGVERLLSAFTLYHQGRVRNLLLSGGSGRLGGGLAEADLLARQLAEWGVDEAHVFRESHSRNTRENAVESARMIAEQRWQRVLLVTSGFHMQRALGCFRRAGVAVDTLAVDFRSYNPAQYFSGPIPTPAALALSTDAIHEWVGRAVYRLRGFSAP